MDVINEKVLDFLKFFADLPYDIEFKVDKVECYTDRDNPNLMTGCRPGIEIGCVPQRAQELLDEIEKIKKTKIPDDVKMVGVSKAGSYAFKIKDEVVVKIKTVKNVPVDSIGVIRQFINQEDVDEWYSDHDVGQPPFVGSAVVDFDFDIGIQTLVLELRHLELKKERNLQQEIIDAVENSIAPVDKDTKAIVEAVMYILRNFQARLETLATEKRIKNCNTIVENLLTSLREILDRG